MSTSNQEKGENTGSDDIWDEYKWEEFMREADKRTDIYMSLLEEYGDMPDADSIIAKKMGWAHLSDNDDELSDLRDDWTDSLSSDDEGEAWKKGTPYDSIDTFDFEKLPVYQKAFDFSLAVFDLRKNELKNTKNEALDRLIWNATIPSSKIAGGFGMGFEMESLGGNIANCKRGLTAANNILDAIYELHKKELLPEDTYRHLQEKAKEVRDELAIWIVELRERFRRGIP